jgi:eukaryotic-like serine/threonine-protein kinase
MAKSRIGPFALEAPLSKPKSSGQVFRAIHLEQRKLAAIRVFPTPLGMTPESRAAFASQLEELKQLRHPSIARCYGGGFDARSAYLAYEMVDGESLDKVLARRGRLPWENAFEYCQQLTDALQYAHQAGWIHGRIRPEKVLIGNDGIARLTDFRRDSIIGLVGAGPPLLNQMLYTAPEIFDSRPADEKTDLYSIGAVLYAMVTGTPPFPSQTVQQLAQSVRTTQPASVSSIAMDCPVWLNAIVEKLLAKDPRQRPYSAQALQLAFKEAQRRQSQGIGVLQHATSGFSPLQMNVDRTEAERVLGIKQPKKKKKRSDASSPFENPILLIVAFAIAVSAVVWFLLPPGESNLRAKAEKYLASKEWIDWNDARDKYLLQLVERFPQGEHSNWAKEQIDWVNMMDAERRIDRNIRMGKTPSSEAERRYVEAKQFEDFGDRVTALSKYHAIVKILSDKEEDRPVINLASRQIKAIEANPQDANQLQKLLMGKLDEARALYDASDVSGAKQIWKSIVDLYEGNEETKPLVEAAQRKLDELKK